MDKITGQRRSNNMRKIKCKDTKPELLVRRLIYCMGYRYRLGGHNLPGKPDLVFLGRKRVIFVHGCFWHEHDAPECKEKHIPKSNLEYWLPKLEKNRSRFTDNIHKLHRLGWKHMVIWECQLKETGEIIKDIQLYLES